MQMILGILNEVGQGRSSLLSLWQAMTEGETKLLILPKENITQLIERVRQILGDTPKKSQDIQKAFTDAKDFADFVDNLKANKLKADKLKQETHLVTLFGQTRTGNDIEKVIYRLATIGLVEDYVVDYNARQYRITIQKQPDAFYIDTLMNYLGLYVSQGELELLRSQVAADTAATVLERCLNLLVGFIYERIAKKRREAIETMHKAAQEGTKDPRLFAERINNYFSSTYLPQLIQSRIEYTLDTVWQYMAEIKQSADILDRAKHLRGSCDRLLIDNPDNGAFYLLRAFATLLINPQSAEILADARKGLQLFQQKERLAHAQMVDLVHRYCQQLVELDPQQGQQIAGWLIPELHQNWLEYFSQAYFQGVLIDG
jgi:hypothetical protein